MGRQARSKAVLSLALAAFLGCVACSRTESPPPVAAPPELQEAKPLPAAQAPAPVVEVAPAPVPYDPEHVSEKRREAARRITLLDPDQFPEAPPELRQALKKLGCRIPQSFATYIGYFEPPRDIQENLISGYFKSTSELHWAVLCSKSGKTSLLLFDSLGQNMERLEGPEKNTSLLVGTDGNDKPDFVWSIAVANKEAVQQEFKELHSAKPQPPPILHEALSSSAHELTSTVYYWHRCKWVERTLGC